jgi:hypothetical protein
MKKSILLTVLCGVLAVSAAAAEKVIKLPAPEKTGGKPFNQALSERKTIRNISAKPLSEQELSNLLYAAAGVSRADGKLTIPTARNVQDIVLYAATKDGLYRYDSAKNELILEQPRDIREFCGFQVKMHTTAPVVLIPVSDSSKMKAMKFPEDRIAVYAPMHIGFAVQNVYLHAASGDFATVVCGALDTKKLAEEMKLPADSLVYVTMPFGKE